MATLLEALGLPAVPVPQGAPPADAPLAEKPVDLKLSPDSPLAQPKPKPPTIDFSKPIDARQVDVFAEAIQKTTDAVLRDKLVKNLREKLTLVPVPFLSRDERAKKIDDAVRSLIESKSKELLLKLLEAAAGQKAQTMPGPDAKPQYGPRVPEKDLGEKIFKIDLPLPGDKPKPVVRGSFEIRGAPRTAKPRSDASFKLLTPHWFHPDAPFSYVVVLEADAFAKNAQGADRLGQVHIDRQGPLDLSVALPEAPGRYVLVVWSGSRFEPGPAEPVEVKP